VQVMLDGEEIVFQRLDMVVDVRVVVEVKSTEILSPHAKRQLHNYLRATSLKVGLLLHFDREPHFYRVCAPNRR
jgi:GxxExxY protein